MGEKVCSKVAVLPVSEVDADLDRVALVLRLVENDNVCSEVPVFFDTDCVDDAETSLELDAVKT